jgi:hypothetical protein
MLSSWFKFTWQQWLTIMVVALGYFVDAYDLLIFSAVRNASLSSIGVPEKDVFRIVS